jgi:hypothetical protein
VNGERSVANCPGRRLLVHHFLVTAYAFIAFIPTNLLAQIQDNSFLLEEAYNQEAGVVQHISAFQRIDGGDWAYNFTQEWPLGGIRHQLSYTLPVENIDGFGTGLGDIGLNYRYQLAGNPQARTVAAPRFTVVLPTGDEKEGRGQGGVGFQVNVPVTLVVSDKVVTHWNAGATLTPSARNALGDAATTHSWNLGASLIWLVRPSFNVLLESVWNDARTVFAEGVVARETGWVISPGFRWAFDVPGDLQIVPGIAYNVGLADGPDENAVFLYLSFEHPFKRQ